MLVFSTRLPLKNTTTQENCLQTFIDWIVMSPHYNIDKIDYDVSSHKNYELSKGRLSVAFRHYKDDEIELSACRLENREQNIVWLTDCIFLCENGNKSLLVQLNANRRNFNVRFPRAHKPYLVRKFVELGYCSDDYGIPVVDKPLVVETGYYDDCVSIMNGNHRCKMPSVYISCDYWGKTALTPEYLAQQLGGIAHVFVESSYETALKLREDTNSNNAHTGYVGIYFPGTKYFQKRSLDYYSNDRELAYEIIGAVWESLINCLDSSTHNWTQIAVLQARQKMAEWKNTSENDQKKLDDFMTAFDGENETLRGQIDELNQQLYALKAERDSLKSALNSKSEEACFYKTGKDPDLYLSERNDLLFSILSQVRDRFDTNSRAYAIISSLLEANPRAGSCARVVEEVNSVFRNGEQLSQNSKARLESIGFTIEEDRRHYKLIFHDPRYTFTVSKTPSDYRGGRNLVSDICKIIDVEKKLWQ